MLNQIQISYPEISNIIYIVIRDKLGQVLNITSNEFVVWVDADIINYIINCEYKGGNLYTVDFPIDTIRGYYVIQMSIRSGLVPLISDMSLDSTLGYWDVDTGNLLPVRVDTLVEYDDGEKFTAKALEDIDVVAVSIDQHNEETTIEEKSCVDQPLSAEGSYETG